MRLQMSGRVKADLWLPFRAEEEVDGRSFSWRARVRLGPVTLVEIADGYAHGVGSSEGLLFGRRPLFAKTVRLGDWAQAGSAACCGAGSGVGGSGGISGSPGGLGMGWSGSTGPGTSNVGAVWVMGVSYPPRALEKPWAVSARRLRAPRARSGWRDRRGDHC
jgi:hypothetical protein